MCGINVFVKAEKHLGFQRLKNFLLAQYLIGFEKNYVSNGSTQGTMFQYVSVFLFCCFPVILCFISVAVVFLRLSPSDECLFLKQYFQSPLQFQVYAKARGHRTKCIIVILLCTGVAPQCKLKAQVTVKIRRSHF